MTKQRDGYMKTCKCCHQCGAVCTTNERDEELMVCFQCGAINLSHRFDVKRFLTDQIHEGAETDDELQELLEAELNEHYGWLDWSEIETMAGMMISQFADQARFDAEAEDTEAQQDYKEKMHDYYVAVGVA